ncbi:MAG TPA: CHAT domain-containing protein [Bacteroidales bacterium]|nr:CHAT domain-containing protein [Bacteroidales bacterium]
MEKQSYDTALVNAEKALQAVKEKVGENDTLYANILSYLLEINYYMGNYSKAIEYGEKEKKIRKKIQGEKHPAYATAINNLAIVYTGMGNYDAAESLYIESKNICKEVLGEKHPDYAISLNNLANLYYAMGKYAATETLYLESNKILKEAFGEKHIKYAGSLNNMAMFYYNTGNYTAAKPLLIEAKNIFKEVLGTKHPDYATSLNNVASLYVDMGNFVEAEPMEIEAKNIRKEILGERHPDYAISLNNLAYLYQSMGNYLAAEPLLAEAMNIRKEVQGEKSADYASSLNNLASIYDCLGNFSATEILYIEARNIRKELFGEKNIKYAGSLNNLAYLYTKMGNYFAAEPLFIEAMNIRKEVLGEKHPDYATSLNNLASLYDNMGNYPVAETLFIEAMNIRKEVLGEKHPDYAASLNNLAVLYHKMGNYVAAEPLYVEAMNICKEILGEKHPDYARSLNNLAEFYRAIGKYDAAEPLYLEAKNIFKEVLGEKHPYYAISLNNLAGLYFENSNYPLAEPLYLETIHITLYNIEQQFSFLSEFEKEKYLATVKKNFHTCQSFIIQRKNKNPGITTEAYNIELATKGLLLGSGKQMRQSIMRGGDTVSIKIYNHWMSSKGTLSNQYSLQISKRTLDTRVLEEETNKLEKELVRISQVYSQGQLLLKTHWEDIFKCLENEEATIEFASFNYYNKGQKTDSILYCALIVRSEYTQPEMVYLFEQKQLDSLMSIPGKDKEIAGNLYSNTGSQINKGTNDNSCSGNLYKLIWEPIDSLLQGVKTIYYSPSGSLHKISFAALNTPDNMYLSDKYNLVQLGSTREIIKLKTQKDYIVQTDSALVFGGINYNQMYAKVDTAGNKNMLAFSCGTQIPNDSSRSAIWGYLKGSMKEAKYVDSLFRKNKVVTAFYSDSNATEGLFKNISGKAPRIIHISTHGFFFPDPVKKDMVAEIGQQTFVFSENPLLRTGLILAGGNNVWAGEEPVMGKDDGILTAYEVSNMDLSNTKLLVLSACQTGLGDIKGNEGVFGLQRAFKMAGVDYIIMSLWSVPDKETTEFMQLFYTNCTKKQTIREAFTNAQAKMRKKYDPYYWAAFVLME